MLLWCWPILTNLSHRPKCLSHGTSKLLYTSFAIDMHEEHARFIEEKMVMQRRDAQTGFQGRAHCGVHFVLEQREITHDHRFRFLALHERSPCHHTHERKQKRAIHMHGNIGARRTHFEDTFPGVPCAVEAGQPLNGVGIERGCVK